MGPADQLTVARIAAAPLIVALFAIDFCGHDYWATALLAIALATDWSMVGSAAEAAVPRQWVRCSTRLRTGSSSSPR
jgi:hypothetical protein